MTGALLLLTDNRCPLISPDGHYRGSPRVERELVYVVPLDDGRQETLSPEEFAQKYGWKNDPERVRLVGK